MALLHSQLYVLRIVVSPVHDDHIVEAPEHGAAEDGEEDVAQQVGAEFAAGSVAEQDAVLGGEWRGAGHHTVRRKR